MGSAQERFSFLAQSLFYEPDTTNPVTLNTSLDLCLTLSAIGLLSTLCA